MLSEIDVINELIRNYTQELFIDDEKTKRAVCMRDVTAHKYQTLRMEDVWHTIVFDIPKLKNQLESLIKKW